MGVLDEGRGRARWPEGADSLDALVGHNADECMCLAGHMASRPLHRIRKGKIDGNGLQVMDLHDITSPFISRGPANNEKRA